ncbi:MAG: ABC transporter permease [Bifidobacterium sp.]|jgi:peptide/nickel transport system permease protein|nr:ABC transporter permease [Bifidobacterium sp.]MCI1865404.1 ABC transporter permease [Bifidobacterium sp.]
MRFVVRRLMLFVVALFGMSILVFAALRVLPGDVASVMAGMNATPQQIARLRAQLGLDRSLGRQYVDWLASLLHGDLGTSVLTGRSVGSQVGSRSSVTFPLILAAMAVAMALGIPLGCEAVLARSPHVRALLHAASIVAGSIPALWGGLLLIMLFSRGSGLVGILPSQGFPQDGWHDVLSCLASLALPALTLGIIVGSGLMRYTRSSLGGLVSSGFIDMAMACGMTRRRAVIRVGLRLAAPQLVSVIGLTFAQMITGAMVVENLFALPGLGAGLIADVGNRDLIAVQSQLFMLVAFFLAMGFLVDILHRALDPRLGKEGER